MEPKLSLTRHIFMASRVCYILSLVWSMEPQVLSSLETSVVLMEHRTHIYQVPINKSCSIFFFLKSVTGKYKFCIDENLTSKQTEAPQCQYGSDSSVNSRSSPFLSRPLKRWRHGLFFWVGTSNHRLADIFRISICTSLSDAQSDRYFFIFTFFLSPWLYNICFSVGPVEPLPRSYRSIWKHVRIGVIFPGPWTSLIPYPKGGGHKKKIEKNVFQKQKNNFSHCSKKNPSRDTST